MILPDKSAPAPDDDDLDLELPGGDGDDEDEESGLRGEESFLPDDDADLGLETDEKSIGLDVDTGLDDGDADLSVGGGGDDDDDEGSWLGEDEIDPVLTGDDSDDLEDEEGSEGDTEPAKDDGEDWADELTLDEGTLPLGDRGEEGFGDDSVASEIELEQLPPLDGGVAAETEDTEVDALGSDLLDEIPIAASPEDTLVEIAPGLRCTRLASSRVAVETLLRIERPLAFLLAAGDAALAWDGALLVLEPSQPPASAARPERRFGGEPRPFAIAARRVAGELLIALGTARGLLCSRDGGRTFAAMTSPVGEEWIASSLAWSGGPLGPRLFASAPAGALWSSDDFGASWQKLADERVLELSADDERSMVAVCRDDAGGGRGLVTLDGGQTFDSITLPVREVERVQDLQALGDLLLCCRRAPTPQLVWRMGDAAWQELSPFACAPATLLDENGVTRAYFFVQTHDRALLLRRVIGGAPGSGSRAPEIVSEFAHDAGTPLQLLAGHHDGLATLHIGTERGWYRVRIRPAGEDA
jgi:hypothetical protein